MRPLTPLSNEALMSLGIKPSTLLKKCKSDLMEEQENAQVPGDIDIERLLAYHEKKRQKLLKQAREKRKKLLKQQKKREAKGGASPTMTKMTKAQKKQERDYERRMKAMEIRVEKTVLAQEKVQMKNEKTKRYEKARYEGLNIGGKQARNQIKDKKHQDAVKQSKQKKKEKEEWLRQREVEESNKLKKLSQTKAKEMDMRSRNLEMKNDRYNQNTEKINRTKHYHEELKKIDKIKKQRRNAEYEKDQERQRQSRREEKQISDLDTRERQERLRLQKEYKNQKKLDKQRLDHERIEATRKMEAKMKAEHDERERQMLDDLKRAREEFENKCKEVRTYGLNQVKNQLKVINMFNKNGGTLLGGRTGKFKAGLSKSDGATTKGVSLPSLPSNNTFMTGET